MTTQCPCKECLVKSMCRNRHYNTLTDICDKIKEFLKQNPPYTDSSLHKIRVKEFERVLKSNVWYLGNEGKNGAGYHIEEKRKDKI